MHDFQLVDYTHHFVSALGLFFSILIALALALLFSLLIFEKASVRKFFKYFLLIFLTLLGIFIIINHNISKNVKYDKVFEAKAKVVEYDNILKENNKQTITLEVNGKKQQYTLNNDRYNYDDDNKHDYVTKINGNIKKDDFVNVKILTNRNIEFSPVNGKPKFGQNDYTEGTDKIIINKERGNK